MVVVKALVHNIPFLHFPLEVGHDRGDVLLHYLQQFLAVVALAVVAVVLIPVGAYPFERLRMPHQCMAAHVHAVAFRHLHQAVSVVEVEVPSARLKILRFHLVLGNHRVEVFIDGFGLLIPVVIHRN